MPIYYVDPAAAGLNDGSSWINAWASMASATAGTVAGDTIYLRGTQTLAAAISTGAAGTVALPIRFIGCDAAGTPRAGQFTLDGNATAANCLVIAHSYNFFENITCENATASGCARTANGTGTQFFHCVFTNNGTTGLSGTLNIAAVSCVFRGNGGAGVATTVTGTFRSCVFAGNATYGINTNGIVNIIDCLAYENGDDNFRLLAGATSSHFTHSVSAYSVAGSGIYAESILVIIRFCALTNNNQYGIENTVANDWISEDFNGFLTNGVGDLLNVTAGANSVTFAADPYVNSAGDNYSTSDTATGRRTAVNLEWA